MLKFCGDTQEEEDVDWKAEFWLALTTLGWWGGVGGATADSGGLSDSSLMGSISLFSRTGSWKLEGDHA